MTFSWDPLGLPVDNWMLDVGSSPGGANFFSSGTLASDVSSIEASGIPTDGRTIYVRLQYLFSGVWEFVDYTYTAADM